MNPKKPYFLLAEPSPGKRIPHLLGRAVLIEGDSLKRPVESQILPQFPEDGPDLQALVKDLYPTHVEVRSAELLRKHARGTNAEAAVQKAIGLFYSHHKSMEGSVSTASFRRTTMEEQHKKLEKLLEHDVYRKPLVEFFTKYPKAKFGLVVSIISCFDLGIANARTEERERGGGVTVQDQVLGELLHTGNIKLQAKGSSNVEVKASATYKDEVILACSYVQLTLKSRESRWKFFKSLKFWKSDEASPYDITISQEPILPQKMTISAPGKRISGDLEVMFSRVVKGQEAAEAQSAERNR